MGESNGETSVETNNLDAMTLRIGEWKKHFTDLQCKLMLSKGLNHCTEHKRMSIAGYLMTKKNLFLILRNNIHISEQLELLNKYLIYEIEREYIWKQKLLGEDKEYFTKIGIQAFKRYPLVNYDLINKLCGGNVEPKYSAEAEKLKYLTSNNNFCSVGNYKHEELIGPVLVDTKGKWEKV